VQDPQKPGRDVQKSRRQHPRLPGPFDGRRTGAFSVDIHIHELNVGGCLVESFHEEPAGRRIALEIYLPPEGWITLQTEALYTLPGYGFAVKFVDTPDETQAALERGINQLLAKSQRTNTPTRTG
jgi:hypothetical protein